MPDLPHRRVVCNSVGTPVEEVSDDGIVEAVSRYLQDNPVAGGSVTESQISAAVAAYLASNPPAAGDVGPEGSQGPQGEPGNDGADGATGTQGPQGPKGDKGDAGAAGVAGSTGATGQTGAQGPQGDVGPQGPKGDTGSQGPTGSTGPAGADGVRTGTTVFGYASGAGGTVAQASSKSTAVTLNKLTGEITMNAAALTAGSIATFALNNSTVAAGDMILVSHHSGGTVGPYLINGRVTGAGVCSIAVRNTGSSSLSEAIVIKFTVIKAATA